MQSNVPLSEYTTLKLGGPARALATATTHDELVSFVAQAAELSLPILVIGGGSNIVMGDAGFPGLVILNRLLGFKILSDSQESGQVIIKIGAGENWDAIVKKTTDLGLHGIEALSAIPGCVGAAPVQNIGAYGQEAADNLLELEAYDTHHRQFVQLSNADCDFTYRHSIFNSSQKGRYIIINVTLQLSRSKLEPPFYDSLQKYIDTHNITDFSPENIRNAVIAIRSIRLPDPALLPNAGSFFKNPVIEEWQATTLKNEYGDIRTYPMGGGMVKISAGWLIEEAGLKGYQQNGVKVYSKNALVLINESATSAQQVQNMRDYIIETVRDKFHITLEQEPEEIGVS